MYMPADKKPVNAPHLTNTIDPKKLTEIRGFEFSPTMMVKDLVKNYHYVGHEASNLSQGVDIIREMVEDECQIILIVNPGIASTGLRDLAAQLLRDKKVACIVASAELVEEDIMKTFSPFRLGDSRVTDAEISTSKMSRSENIFIPNDDYARFETWHVGMMEDIFKEKKTWSAAEYIKRIGVKLKDESSIVYWAGKRGVNIITPELSKGRMSGHWAAFNKTKNGEKLSIDDSAAGKTLAQQLSAAAKTAVIIIGETSEKNLLVKSIVEHPNTRYFVTVHGKTTSSRAEENLSWEKLNTNKKSVHIASDSAVVFPLLMTGFYS